MNTENRIQRFFNLQLRFVSKTVFTKPTVLRRGKELLEALNCNTIKTKEKDRYHTDSVLSKFSTILIGQYS